VTKGKKRKEKMIAAGEISDFPVRNDLQSASHIIVLSLKVCAATSAW